MYAGTLCDVISALSSTDSVVQRHVSVLINDKVLKIMGQLVTLKLSALLLVPFSRREKQMIQNE